MIDCHQRILASNILKILRGVRYTNSDWLLKYIANYLTAIETCISGTMINKCSTPSPCQGRFAFVRIVSREYSYVNEGELWL